MVSRCAWVADNNLLYQDYHDTEWGVPIDNDTKLFEFLVLESAQAGLSWLTILKKRSGFRQAFAFFDPVLVARFQEVDVERLMTNSNIIRNRLKIKAAINNAQKFLEIQKAFGSFAKYQWQFVDNRPLQNNWSDISQIPTISRQSIALSNDLKKRGFKFLGPTIIYAHMQAVGMVNDHTIDCFRHKIVSRLGLS